MRFAWMMASATAAAVASTASPVHAQRPTEGGIFSYDASDVLDYWEEPTGTVRVHFSVSGPNVTVLDDSDGDGIPDYPQLVATTTLAVFDFYENDRGFRGPVREVDIGLGEPGGSPAFDVYLVDFGGNADGSFGIDDCLDTPVIRCAGYFSMENDFLGYNYPSLEDATNVLASHELFHAIQAAYTIGLPVWFSEGTATWAEKQWDTESLDFLRLTGAYFRDIERSIDRPPGGPVPAFAYATALFFDFLSTRSDHTIIVEFLDALDSTGEGVDAMAAMEAVLGGPDVLRSNWLDFVAWNLATGDRSGGLAGYPYADALAGITATAEGSAIDHENRFYPLAASYYRLDHPGGPMYFGTAFAAPELHFGLHPVIGGATDGPVDSALSTWTADSMYSRALLDGEELPAGGYWLWVTKPERAESSTRVRICLGSLDTATACAPLAPGTPMPPGPDMPPDTSFDDSGCTVSTSPTHQPGWLLPVIMLLGALVTRRAAIRRRHGLTRVVDASL